MIDRAPGVSVRPAQRDVTEPPNRDLAVGRISGIFGVRGWVRVYSYTEPRLNIVDYSPWHLRIAGDRQIRRVLNAQMHGEGVVAQLEGIDDREAAAALVGAEIEINRSQLGSAGTDQFFWVDLQGMEVRTPADGLLGVVDHLFATGANDVMVVVGTARHLIPFVMGSVIKNVDVERRTITADWDDDF